MNQQNFAELKKEIEILKANQEKILKGQIILENLIIDKFKRLFNS